MILASDISIGEAGVYALLGYAVVFFGIVLLMMLPRTPTWLPLPLPPPRLPPPLLPPQRPRLWLPAPPANWRSMTWSPRPQQCSWPSWPTRWASL